MAMPVVVIRLKKRRALSDSGVVDQNVSAATESFGDAPERALDALFVRDIAGEKECRSLALALNLSGDARDLCFSARGDGDACALARKTERDGASDTAPASGDQCNPVFESQG